MYPIGNMTQGNLELLCKRQRKRRVFLFNMLDSIFHLQGSIRRDSTPNTKFTVNHLEDD